MEEVDKDKNEILTPTEGRPLLFNQEVGDLRESDTSATIDPAVSKTPFQLDPDFLRRVQEYYNRKKNAGKDSKQTRAKKLKAKKAARRRANASRKINQAQNRKNKFQK